MGNSQFKFLYEYIQGLNADIKASNFPKKYINFVKECFLRDGYVLALHKSAIPYTKEASPLINGLPNNGGTSLVNTLFMASSSFATINYAIPDEKAGYPNVLLVLMPQACLNQNNPEGLFLPTNHSQYCEDFTHYIDPSYILGYFSQDINGKYSFTSNIPKDNGLGIKKGEFLNPDGLYSDIHTCPGRVPADLADRKQFGNMKKRDDSLILYHPILARLALRYRSKQQQRFPISESTAKPVSDIRGKYEAVSPEVPAGASLGENQNAQCQYYPER